MAFVKKIVLVLLAYSMVCVDSRDPRRGGLPSATIADDIFLQGRWIEAAINPGGGFGSRQLKSRSPYSGTPVPPGYHPSYNDAGGRLGVVVDYDYNGFEVGNPPQSGDAFLEGYDDVGWYVSWKGHQGLQAFNNMPLLNDDDDGDTRYAPHRGCLDCSKGKLGSFCDPFSEDCSCNQDIEAANYNCPFKRWDITTLNFSRVDDPANPNLLKVVYFGLAEAKAFVNSHSGNLMAIKESITIKKEISFDHNSTLVFERVELFNSGEVDLEDVSIMWSIVPTLECFPHDDWPKSPKVDYNNYFSIPYQGTDKQAKTLIKARGPTYNMTVALGTSDNYARAWYTERSTWQATGGNMDRRPYSGNWVWSDPRSATKSEIFSEMVMALAIYIPKLAVGQKVNKVMFWGFSADELEAGLKQIETEGTTTGQVTGSQPTGQVTGTQTTTGQATGQATGQVTGTEPTGQVTGTQPTGQVTGSLSTGQVTGTEPTGQATGTQPTGQATGQVTGTQPTGQATGQVTGTEPTGQVTGTQPTGQATGTQPTGQVTGTQTTTGGQSTDSTTVSGRTSTGVSGRTTTLSGTQTTVSGTGRTTTLSGSQTTVSGTGTQTSTGVQTTVSGTQTSASTNNAQSTTQSTAQVTGTQPTGAAGSTTVGSTLTPTGGAPTGFVSTLTTKGLISGQEILSESAGATSKDKIDARIIGAIFGTAGFLLLLLVIFAVALALRNRSQQ